MDNDDDDPRCIVIDNGSSLIKAGFAGDDEPRAVFSSVVGRPKITNLITGGAKTVHIGDDAIHQGVHNELSLSYPIEHGIITNWDDMELIWNHMFSHELRVPPEEWNCVLSEPVLTPVAQREKTTQVFFESFGVPGFYSTMSGILAAYASGRGICLACESGDGVTQITPIYEGYILRDAVRRIDFGGRDLTHFMSRRLYDSGYSLSTAAEMEVVRQIKEQKCYVAEDFDTEMKKFNIHGNLDKPYTMFDGTTITLGKQTFECPEVIFNPQIAGVRQPGLHQLILDSLQECDIDNRSNLYCSICIFGGNTMFRGIRERLKRELAAALPNTRRFNVVCAPERKLSVWIGGSIIGSLSTFYDGGMLITKQDYEEYGPSIVHRKCF